MFRVDLGENQQNNPERVPQHNPERVQLSNPFIECSLTCVVQEKKFVEVKKKNRQER